MKSVTLVDIIQTYNFYTDNSLDDPFPIFKDIDVDERINKDTLILTLIDVCGSMRCIYNTTGTFKFYSDNFFKKYKWNISKLLDTMEYEYDPLIDKKNNWVETTKITQNLATVENSEEERNKGNTGTQKTDYGEDEENTISAMNSNSYQPDSHKNVTGTNTKTDNLQEKVTANKDRDKTEDLTWDEKDTHTEDGINTSYQELIERERKIDQFNIYNWISKRYASELFLLVY